MDSEERGKNQCDFDLGYNFHPSAWKYLFTQYRKVDGNIVFIENIKIGCVCTIYLSLLNGVEIEFEKAEYINNLKWT